ncbi:MAG TPA: ImmA/IrrE family metallo-endopeptidase [Gemmatimonadaceae bacterium]|jgi:HTH-type transcriptional regulator/antitoxin HigA
MLDSRDFRTPGQYLKALLEANGWTQRVLATIMAIDESSVARLAQDRRAIDAETSLILADIFGVPDEAFLEIQTEYDLAKAKIEARPDPLRSARAQIFGQLPVTEMIGRGWIYADDIRDMPKVEASLASFFGVDSINQIEIVPHAAKRTNVRGDVTAAQLAWLYRVRQIAEGIVVPKYSTKALVAAIAKLRELLASPDEARKAPRILAEAGVRLVVVESLAGAKIDGVCFWLDERSPVIGLSMRFDRIDNFWFVLRHECEHVLRGHGRSIVALDTELERDKAGTGSELEEQERVANEAAADFCVPNKTLKQFIARKAPIFTERDILSFAKMVKVHPGLVAGQLQHATARYERFRDHIAKIRDIVLPNVLHDGWGDVAPVEPSL